MNATRLDELAKAQGWTVGRTRRQHVLYVAPDGQRAVGAGTTSDWRSGRNLHAQLRRMGLADEMPQTKKTTVIDAPAGYERNRRSVDQVAIAVVASEVLRHNPLSERLLVTQVRQEGVKVVLEDLRSVLTWFTEQRLVKVRKDQYIYLQRKPFGRGDLRFCVWRKGIWHATYDNQPHGETDTLCGYLTAQTIGFELRTPQCPYCLQYLRRQMHRHPQ